MAQSVQRIPRRRRSQSVNAQPLKLWQDTSNAPEVRIEIVPLIDVIFCILTFFILAAVGFSRQQAISLDLPQASTGTAQMRELIVISLDDFGQIYVEQQPVATRNQLAQAVENYFLTQPDGRVVLRASRNAIYDDVVQVLDLLRDVGGDRVALATFPEGDTPASEFEAAPQPGFDGAPGFDQFGDEFNGLPGDPTLPPAADELPGVDGGLVPNLPPQPRQDSPGQRSRQRSPASDGLEPSDRQRGPADEELPADEAE